MESPKKDLFTELLELTVLSLDDDNDKNKQRDRFIDAIFTHGGKEFVKRVEKYGYTEKGDKVVLDDWFREYLELIGDYRIPHTITQGCSQTGKAQPLYSKILTPTGWATMAEIKPNSQVIGSDGQPKTVLAVYPQGKKQVFKVIFNDGSSTECCDDHLWTVEKYCGSINRQRWKTLTLPLSEIRQSLFREYSYAPNKRRFTYRVKHVNSVAFEPQVITVPPYLLGVLIGDGCLTHKMVHYSTADREIVETVASLLPPDLITQKSSNGNNPDPYMYAIRRKDITGTQKDSNSLTAALRKLGLQGKKSYEKFIPLAYKYNTEEIRLEVLRGLLDTDGSVSKTGVVSFASTSRQLAEDVREIVRSLGGTTTWSTYLPKRKVATGDSLHYRECYKLVISFPNPRQLFRLERKKIRCTSPRVTSHSCKRTIVQVKHVDYVEAQCILVDSNDHLYVTDDYILTHNTLGHNLLLADTIVHGKLNCGWMFSSRDSREVNVPEQQKPLLEKYAEEYEKSNGIKIKERSDRKLSSRFQIGGITAIFSYLSTSKASESKSGLAAAGASAVSFTAHVCFVEEAGQSTPEAAEVVMPRLAASKVPTRPRRDLGTPGSGASSVDVIMTQTDRNFYPTVQCKSCRKYTPLHPFGCLLKPIQRKNHVGKMVTTYLSESGRPLLWHCHDPNNPVDTAFIGCPNCGAELDDETRYNARYRCTRTQEWLRDYLDSLPVNDPEACANMRSKIGIHISPLVRKTRQNLAADIIDKGLKSARTADFIQQVLGLTSDNFVTGVTLEMLKKSLAAPKPDGTPDFVLCGMDMGRAHDFLTIAEFYLPEDYLYLDQVELSRKTIRRIVFSSEVIREKAKDIISQHKTTYGICDNEPGRDSVMTFCNEVGLNNVTRLEMADQKDTLKDAVKFDKVKDGGAEYPCWFVRNQKFQDLILENFIEMAEDGHSLYRLPEVWHKHLNSKSDLSPFKHLTSPTRDPETDKWVRAADGNDDLFYSFLFLEVAFYIYCEKFLKYPVWIGGV